RRRADGLRRRLRPGRFPELSGDGERVDPGRFPPLWLVARAVKLAMVQAAERNREFVADLAPEGELLGEAHVVRLGRLPPANEAGAGGDVFQVLLVANAPRFRECKDALVDAVGGAFLRIRSHPLAGIRPVSAGFVGAIGLWRLWFPRFS